MPVLNYQQVFDLIGRKLIELAVPVGVIFIIASGIMIMAAGSDPERMAKAKRTFFYTIGGLLLVFAVSRMLIGNEFVNLMNATLGLSK
jgi:hypothetical protein